jgi:hypothetical protein
MGIRERQGLVRLACRWYYVGLGLTGFRSCAPRGHNDDFLFGWAKFLPHVKQKVSQINRNILMGHH